MYCISLLYRLSSTQKHGEGWRMRRWSGKQMERKRQCVWVRKERLQSIMKNSDGVM